MLAGAADVLGSPFPVPRSWFRCVRFVSIIRTGNSEPGTANRGTGNREPDARSAVSVVSYTAGMSDAEPVVDAATVRIFVAVLVCETLTIVALWAFERLFS